jgi:uncharacterized protein YdeI (YjbR/CyaY-like superfamily)
MKSFKNADEFFKKKGKWQSALAELRSILADFPLEETVKWGAPIYTVNGKNVVGLAGFKNHFALWFFQGVFLKDKSQKLVNAQEGTTKALRQWRFETEEEMLSEKAIIKAYILEAIDNEKKGKRIKPTKNLSFEIPKIFQEALDKNTDLKKAYESLTPGRQKEYALHIGEAKREATALSRIEKSMPLILSGKGLYDKYKNC